MQAAILRKAASSVAAPPMPRRRGGTTALAGVAARRRSSRVTSWRRSFAASAASAVTQLPLYSNSFHKGSWSLPSSLFSWSRREWSTRPQRRQERHDNDLDDDDVLSGFSRSTSINNNNTASTARSPLQELRAELERQRLADAEIRATLDQKKGRLWTDEWDLEDMLLSKETLEELPEWSPSLVSRISNERVQIYHSSTAENTVTNTIPTLEALATLVLPPPPPPNPGLGQTKSYALYRKRALYRHIYELVVTACSAGDRLSQIRALESWEEKQDAVDDLFDDITAQLQEQEEILGKHPQFETWVEQALEQYLRQSQMQEEDAAVAAGTEAKAVDATAEDSSALTRTSTADNSSSSISLSAQLPSTPVPIFMDCFGPHDTEEDVIPKILSPLKVWERGSNAGKMVEEWQLSAHKRSKRIMLRHCTQQIAKRILPHPDSTGKQQSRILVSGRQGVGKSAALAAVVASARHSGAIVLYLPDGDRLHQNGFYIEPNTRRKGVFDLPILSQQVCQQFLDSHKDDLQEFASDKATLQDFFTTEQVKTLLGESGESLSLVDLLRTGASKTSVAAPCYAAVVHVLMNQDQKSFFVVLDEFNCYFAPGQYYHGEYKHGIERPIPYDEMSLFQPALHAMGVATVDLGEYGDLDADEKMIPPVMMKRGAIIVATSESRAIARKVTDALILNAQQQQQQRSSENDDATAPIYVVDVPRLSSLEIEHMLANYEATGVGKLRMDRGETVMNQQEVAYLSMVSGGVAQKLMDACMM